MDREEMWEQLEYAESLISRLEDYCRNAQELRPEAESLLRDLRRQAERLREAIGEEEEKDREALCREYEKSVL